MSATIANIRSRSISSTFLRSHGGTDRMSDLTRREIPPIESGMNRRRLPNRRMSLTLEFEHAMQPGESPRSYLLTIGVYRSGRIGEIFFDGVKIGSTLKTHLDDGATLASRSLQYGDHAADLSRRLTEAGVIREALRIAAAIEAGGPEADF